MKKVITASIDEGLAETMEAFLKLEGGTRSNLISGLLAGFLKYDIVENIKIETLRPMYPHKCLQCMNTWKSFKQKPAVCPSCKSYNWSVRGSQRAMHIELQLLCSKFGTLIPEIAARLDLPEDNLTAVLKKEKPIK